MAETPHKPEPAKRYRLSCHPVAGPEERRIEKEVARQVARLQAHMARRPDKPAGLRLWLYVSDADAERCTGRSTNALRHNTVMKRVAAIMARHGVTITLVPVHSEEFLHWLGEMPRSPQSMSRYITRDWQEEQR